MTKSESPDIENDAPSGAIIPPHALGTNISGVMISAIFAAVYVALLLPKG